MRWVSAQASVDCLCEIGSPFLLQLRQMDEASGAFQTNPYGFFTLSGNDRVRFPVTGLLALLDIYGTTIDGNTVWNVAFSVFLRMPTCLALLMGSYQQRDQLLSFTHVRIVDVLIDRLNNLNEERLHDNAIPSILKALANHMDEAELHSDRGHWGTRGPWSAGRVLFKNLLARLRDDLRSGIINETFASGKSIGWLMCELIRSQIFAHGRYGDRPTSEESWVLSKEELDDAIKLLLGRFKSTDRERIIDTPEVLSLMYGWMQARRVLRV